MFSGIVKDVVEQVNWVIEPDQVKLVVRRPNWLVKVSQGDSIALNGVCLTVVEFSDSELGFEIGSETLRITGWDEADRRPQSWNFEDSLRLGDAIHGHLVTGHVDAMAQVLAVDAGPISWDLRISSPPSLVNLIWPKGSVAINGVSLTINHCEPDHFAVCIIPETLRRTNLKQIKPNDWVTIEADNMARGLLHQVSLSRSSLPNSITHNQVTP